LWGCQSVASMISATGRRLHAGAWQEQCSALLDLAAGFLAVRDFAVVIGFLAMVFILADEPDGIAWLH
jgi:uncharacterized membrane protein HdeD (DUF308 family)